MSDDPEQILERAKRDRERTAAVAPDHELEDERKFGRVRRAIDAMGNPHNPMSAIDATRSPPNRGKKLPPAEFQEHFADRMVELASALDNGGYADRLAELASGTSQDDKARALAISLLMHDAKEGNQAKVVRLLGKAVTEELWSRVHHVLCTFDELLWGPIPDDYFHAKLGSYAADLHDAPGDDWRVIRGLSRELFQHSSFTADTLAQLKDWLGTYCRAKEYEFLRIPEVRRMLEKTISRETGEVGGQRAPRVRSGRKVETDLKEDKRIFDEWNASGYGKVEDFARKNGYPEKDVRKAMDRHKKRLAKAKAEAKEE